MAKPTDVTRDEEMGGQFQDIEGAEYPPNVPYPYPLPLPRASGLYEVRRRRTRPGPMPQPRPAPGAEAAAMGMMGALASQAGGMEDDTAAIYPWIFSREELRLDVDGRYPQMMASGTMHRSLSTRVDWIAKLTSAGINIWSGPIWYKDNSSLQFPYTNIAIRCNRNWFTNQRKATVTFSGGGASDRIVTFNFKSPYFRRIEFEFDRTEDAAATVCINTCDHPNHPDTLACEFLTIDSVFRRTGFDVRQTGDSRVVDPMSGGDGKWSNMELHDAMQAYWSSFAGRSQWSMWTFFAAQHEMGAGLGGIMFDQIGPNHRQGCAVFTDSFISKAPAGDTAPEAWVPRMRFWTAVHEMGHCFNLAHSWQKALGTPWIPLSNEPEARSFMNYPYRVSGGQSAFFEDFDFRFSSNELMFLRHAPARFVQMGNADWFDHHGFQQANLSREPQWRLEVRANRATPLMEFLEPVVLELKLTNISGQAQLIREDILKATENMTIILKREGRPARQYAPYARYCTRAGNIAVNRDDSLYESLFVSAGLNGWDLAEPGNYTVQVALHLDTEDIVSAPMRLRVAPPQRYAEELMAQDFFSEDVGRILNFDGSQFLSAGNETLLETMDRFQDRRVACHARIALGNACMRDAKLLKVPETPMEQLMQAVGAECRFEKAPARVEEARSELSTALTASVGLAAETLGHIDYKYYADRFTDWLDQEGDPETAAHIQDTMHQILSNRQVLPSVLSKIASRRDKLKKKRKVA